MHLKEGSPTLENVSIDAFADPQMADLLQQLHKAQEECNKKEQVIQALRAKKNGGRAEPETAEDAGTLHRGLAEAQAESNRMAKEVQELTS